MANPYRSWLNYRSDLGPIQSRDVFDIRKNPLVAPDPFSTLLKKYYDRETGKLGEAYQKAQPSAQEEELIKQQAMMAQQALKDRRATRAIVLAKMGLKSMPDGSIVRMTPQERAEALSEVETAKTSAVKSYQERAQAAAKGETKLPSFLKKEVDYQAEKEKALLTEMLGPDAVNSTTFQQAIAAQSKGAENLRGQIQDQDLATTPGMAQQLSGQMIEGKDREIAAINALPNRNIGLMQNTASVLNSLQQKRLDQYNKDLKRIEKRRADVTGLLTLGGLIGGSQLGQLGKSREEEPAKIDYTPYSSYGPYASGYRY